MNSSFARPLGAIVAVAAALFAASPVQAQQPKTLRAVMHADLKIIDPIWTRANMSRNHGFMIYETLFAPDEVGEIKPLMVDTYTATTDGLHHTFKLRDLLWHDGAPVTAEDCVASIKRWAVRDSVGQKMMSFVDAMTVTNATTFEIKLKSRTNLMPAALGKAAAPPPFMMPKRIAETDPFKQIADPTGSGPFMFKKDEWKPGDRAVYVRNPTYRSRSEPSSGMAGGRQVKVDRVEWLSIPDAQQALNALQTGDVDVMEIVSLDLIPLARKDKSVVLHRWNKLGNQSILRPNHTHKPFDNPKIRQALWHAVQQTDILDAQVGIPDMQKPCRSFYACETEYANEAPMTGLLDANAAKSRALLQEAGYDGTPIVLLHMTDVTSLVPLAPVVKQQMERGGFKVDMQSLDTNTLVARVSNRQPTPQTNWHAYPSVWPANDTVDPLVHTLLSAACEKASPGWPCDAQLEKLRDDFARAPDPAERKRLATEIQKRAIEVTAYVPLGQYLTYGVHRANIAGWLVTPAPVFWNIEKK